MIEYIKDILEKPQLKLSFEVFPSKRLEGNEKAEFIENVKAIAEGACPSFMSVTYRSGSEVEDTLELAEAIQSCGVTAMAHLTALRSTLVSTEMAIEGMKSRGIKNLLALRGDRSDEDKDLYKYAFDLVDHVRSLTSDICIGGACYPEKHPEAVSLYEDIDNLRMKQDVGCQFFITQMFFDNEEFLSFLAKARAAGITVPIIPGVMPITHSSQIKRVVELSSSRLSKRFYHMFDRFGDDPKAMYKAGLAYATEQIIDLFANGANNVHVYSMNKVLVAKAIKDNLKGIVDDYKVTD